MHVVDLACGHGRVTRELARRGGRVTGVDLSANLLTSPRPPKPPEPLGITYLNQTSPPAAPARPEVRRSHVQSRAGRYRGPRHRAAHRCPAAAARRRFVFSLLHPCFPGWDQDAPSSWPPRGGYHAEGWWLAHNPGIRGKVGSHHRTLSTYLNSLVRHHLAVEQAAEPGPVPRSCPASAQHNPRSAGGGRRQWTGHLAG